MSVLCPQDLTTLITNGVPQFGDLGIVIDQASEEGVVARLPFREDSLRPGGTISGPTLFALADAALYAAVLAHLGPVELAVTTQMSINFMRKPSPGAVLAKARLLKPGKRLLVGDVFLHSETLDSLPVAHASGTYSAPPK